jgi:hypothetical protein
MSAGYADRPPLVPGASKPAAIRFPERDIEAWLWKDTI